MAAPPASVKVNLRIPGTWSNPGELIERLPDGCRLAPESLFLPDGTEVEFGALDADSQFAQIFRTSCRNPPTDDELATVDRYTVNVCVSGPGGSLDAARKIMQAGAAIVRAGGAGVFIDNSALAHGGGAWLQMTDDGGPDALSFAFVAVVSGRTEAWTMGMHVLGLRDVVMKRADAEAEEFGIIDVLRYLARGEKPVEDGHLLADLSGPRFQVFTQNVGGGPAIPPGSPLHNPFGRLRVVNLRDIAENN
jgi:hypothetical protein